MSRRDSSGRASHAIRSFRLYRGPDARRVMLLSLVPVVAAVLLLLLKSAFITRVQVPYDLYAPRLTEWRIGLRLPPFVLLFARFLSLDRARNWCLWLLAVLGWMLQAYFTLAGLAPGEQIPRRDRGFPIIAIALTWLVLRLGRDRQR